MTSQPVLVVGQRQAVASSPGHRVRPTVPRSCHPRCSRAERSMLSEDITETPRRRVSKQMRKASSRQDYGSSLHRKMVYLQPREGETPSHRQEHERQVVPPDDDLCSSWQVCEGSSPLPFTCPREVNQRVITMTSPNALPTGILHIFPMCWPTSSQVFNSMMELKKTHCKHRFFFRCL